MSFVNNSGFNGGALGLIGSSRMTVGANNFYQFINNSALYRGGAVYVLLTDSIDFISSRSCFIQYVPDDDTATFHMEWNINFTFTGNKAKTGSDGHSIYVTSLLPCQVVREGSFNRPEYLFLNASDVFTAQGIIFDNDTTLQPQIATDEKLIHSTKRSPLKIIPGERYEHGVELTDDFSHPTEMSFRVAVNKILDGDKIDSTSSFVRDKIQMRGNPGESATLYLGPLSPRQNYVELKVELLECPLGYKLNDNYICVCDMSAHLGIFKCDLEKFHSHLLPGFWAGLIDTGTQGGTELVTSRCPFCNYSNNMKVESDAVSEFAIVLPRNFSELSKTVCGKTRTGVVCGRCRDGYTVHFHSPGFLCKPAEPAGCKLGWLFYILSELVPVTAVFITVLVLNISFTSGAVNGFILFGQILDSFIIDASGIITFPKSIRSGIRDWIQRYQVIYGFINFDFFNSESLSFCLWEKASALDMLAMKYVTILYTLVLIVAVIWLMNKYGGSFCGRFCRITVIRASVVHGISTFLVICYAKCVKVSLDLLIPVWPERKGMEFPARVWLNGDLLYFRSGHLPYAIPSLLCLATIGVIPLVLLLTYPLGNKVLFFFGCDDLNAVNFISQKLSITSLKPLLDSIQGSFKDNFRFFAGLYFLYRWVIPIIIAISDGFGYYYPILGGVLLFILTVHTICQPYVKRIHNIIDTLLFANLALINFLSFFNYFKVRSQWQKHRGVTVTPTIIQLFLIYLPLIVTSVYLLVITFKKLFNYCNQRRSKKFFIKLSSPKKAHTLRGLIESISTSVKAKDSNMEEEEEEHSIDRLEDEDTEYTNRYEYFKCKQ